MDEKGTDTQSLQIAKDHIVPLVAQFDLVQNGLSGLIDVPPASGSSAKAADAWWQELGDEDRYTYRGALAAIASPMLIADVGINALNRKLIITHAVLPSLRWNDPAYLLALDADKKHFRLEYLKQADLFTNTLLLYLQGAAPVYEMEMKFEVSVRDFAVLLGLTDLVQRLQFRALLDHAVAPSSVKADDVMVAVSEGFVYPDPRWLLAFALPLLHLSPAAMARESVRQSLDNLARIGLVKKNGDGISLTEPGERFCESVAGRTACIRIDTWGADEKGRLGRQGVLFIRGEHFLWYAGTSGKKADTMVVVSTGLDRAEAILKELFTPLAAPKIGAPLRPEPAVKAPAPAAAVPPAAATTPPPPVQEPAPAAVMPSVPATVPKAPAAAGMVCRACGNPLQPGDKYCSNCLVKVPDVMGPAPVVSPAPASEPPPSPPQVPPASPVPAPAAAGGMVCKACGNPLQPGDKFCSKCLVKVPEAASPAPAPATLSPPPPPPPVQEPAPAAPGAGGMVCKACGNPLKPGDKYCSKCLVKVPETPPPVPATAPASPPPPPPPAESAPASPVTGEQVCKSCGAPIRPGLKFCSNCGKKIG